MALEIDLADTLFVTDKLDEAYRSLTATAQRAAEAGDRIGELCARLEAGSFKLYIDPQGAGDELEGLIDEAGPELEAAGEDFALYLFHFARAVLFHLRSRSDEELAATEQMLFHAERTGLPHVFSVIPGGGGTRFQGSTPVSDLLAWIDEREARLGPDWRMFSWKAVSLAVLGRFEDARRLMSESHNALEERGELLGLGSNLAQMTVLLELLAGDPAAAAAVGERGCRILEEGGERAWLSTGACFYAEALYELGRLDEADNWARKGLALGGSDDAMTQVQARRVQAKVLARRGEHQKAEVLAREATTLAKGTDSLLTQGDALRDLAEVLELESRRDEAVEALRDALKRYERKGAVVPADLVRERLAALEPASA